MQRQLEPESKNASLNLTMYSSLSEARILISLRALSFSLSFMPSSLTFLSAQTWLSSFLRTRNTCPKAPSPSFFWISKSCSDPSWFMLISSSEYNYMAKHTDPQLASTDFRSLISTNSTFMAPRKVFKLDMLNGTISADLGRQSIEEEKLREFVEDYEKDLDRYSQIKQKMKEKFFRIQAPKQPRVRRPPALSLEGYKQYIQSSRDRTPSLLLSNRSLAKSTRMSGSQHIAEQLQNLFKAAAPTKAKMKVDVLTRSQIQKKTKQNVDKERDLILKFVKKSSELDFKQKNWSDLTNIEKYMMNFTDYMRAKTKLAIEKDVYVKKISKKMNEMQKFQDFILEEVRFSNENKEKLANFFKHVKLEFQKADAKMDRNQRHQFYRQVRQSSLQAARKRHY